VKTASKKSSVRHEKQKGLSSGSDAGRWITFREEEVPSGVMIRMGDWVIKKENRGVRPFVGQNMKRGKSASSNPSQKNI